MKRPAGSLRDGYTTGSAVCAAAVAAFRQCADPVELLLPGGGKLTVPVKSQCGSCATVVKDGGDDPDVTTGMDLSVEVTPFDGPAETADYEESSGELTLVIRGGTGIGRVTRPGLAVPVGKYAVNPMPRKMLLRNLTSAGCRGRYLVKITAPEGEERAKQTLNPTLGIVGGISILGNSGIVHPYSNAAYAATIALQMRSLAAVGVKRAAVTTGSRSEAAVKRDFPDLPENAVIRIGDFIHHSLVSAANNGMEEIIVGCMPGKLFKYACGERNTHAHQSKLTPARLREFGIELPGVPLEKIDTMGELSAHLTPEQFQDVLGKLYPISKKQLQEWAGKTVVELVLYDDAGNRLISMHGPEK
ncbi:MAG: cobalt-precorrin-5B (C(1))-methyltransferase [Lentisphaeria bacterium]|nr:cobalt-precorrin-5B (C(1))-methyltransferase [Lentisphaeria bacterium]